MPVQVGVELPKVLVGKRFGFQFDQYVAFQNPVTKDKIDVEVLATNSDSLLSCLEAEPTAKFQQERL